MKRRLKKNILGMDFLIDFPLLTNLLDNLEKNNSQIF